MSPVPLSTYEARGTTDLAPPAEHQRAGKTGNDRARAYHGALWWS